MIREPSLADRAEQLRHAFDAAFSAPPRVAGDPPEDFLAIRVGRAPYALRLSEVSGLYPDKPITALPGGSRALRGVAAFRGAIVVVYDLCVLLGETGDRPGRWIVVTSPDSTVGLAFDDFEGHLHVDRHMIAAQEGTEHAQEAVRTDDVVRPIIPIPKMILAIRRPRQTEEKER